VLAAAAQRRSGQRARALRALVLVRVARIQVVEREVVAAGDDAELVRLPVVVDHHQAVRVAQAWRGAAGRRGRCLQATALVWQRLRL